MYKIASVFLVAIVAALPVSVKAELRMISDPTAAAKEVFRTGRFDTARQLLPSCRMKVFDDNYRDCAAAVPALVMGYVAKKDYATAAKYLPALKVMMTNAGLRSPAACLHDTVYLDRNLGDEYYSLGYEQTAYQIARRLNTKNADSLALRAFLCASFHSKNYKFSTLSVENPPLSRKDFITTIERIYGKSPAYDVATYLDEVLTPLVQVSNKLKPIEYAKKIALYKNGARHCDDIGLDPAFSKFLEDLANEYTYYAKEHAQ